jgi:hypothetical protein
MGVRWGIEWAMGRAAEATSADGPLGPVIERVADAYLRKHRRKAAGAFARWGSRPTTLEAMLADYIPVWNFVGTMRDPGIGTGLRREYIRTAAALEVDVKLVPPYRERRRFPSWLLWPVLFVLAVPFLIKRAVRRGRSHADPPHRIILVEPPRNAVTSGARRADVPVVERVPRPDRWSHDVALQLIEILAAQRPDLMRELARRQSSPRGEDQDFILDELHPRLVAFREATGFPYEAHPIFLLRHLQMLCFILTSGHGSPGLAAALGLSDHGDSTG